MTQRFHILDFDSAVIRDTLHDKNYRLTDSQDASNLCHTLNELDTQVEVLAETLKEYTDDFSLDI